MRQLRKPPNAPAGRNPLPAASQDKTNPTPGRNFRHGVRVFVALLALPVAGVALVSTTSGSAKSAQSADAKRPAVTKLAATVPGIRDEVRTPKLVVNSVQKRHDALVIQVSRYVAADMAHKRVVAQQAAQAAAQAKARAAVQHSRGNSSSHKSNSNPSSYHYSGGTSGYGVAAWNMVAKCETGSNWSHQTAFDGGLGILHSNWVHYGGTQFAAYGSQASPADQVNVANRIAADISFNPTAVTSCSGYHGW